MRKRIGTDEIAGAIVISLDYNGLILEKDGRKLYLDLEYESDYNSFCEGSCNCCYSSTSGAYFVAEEEV